MIASRNLQAGPVWADWSRSNYDDTSSPEPDGIVSKGVADQKLWPLSRGELLLENIYN